MSQLPTAPNFARTTSSAANRNRIVATPGVIASMGAAALQRAAQAATPRTIATPAASLIQVAYPVTYVDGGSLSAPVQVNFSNRGTVLGFYGTCVPVDASVVPMDVALAAAEVKIEIQGASYLTSNGNTADFVPLAAMFPAGAGYLSLAWPVQSGDRWLLTFRNTLPASGGGHDRRLTPKVCFTFALQ